MLLLSNSGNGTGTAVLIRDGRNKRSSSLYTVYLSGTFDGATAKLQSTPDDGTTWHDIPDATATAATVINVEIRTTGLRAVVSGGGGSTSITVRAV